MLIMQAIDTWWSWYISSSQAINYCLGLDQNQLKLHTSVVVMILWLWFTSAKMQRGVDCKAIDWIQRKNKKNTTIKQYNINKIIIRTIVRENCVKPPYEVDETGDTDLWFSVWSLPLFSSGIFPGLSFTPHSPRRTFPSYLTAPPLPPI